MTNKTREIEIFSAGCPVCQETVEMVKRIACSSCEIRVLDMYDPQVATRAKSLGVHSVPSVAINGELVSCCAGRGPDEKTLRKAGVGRSLS
jgi:hypothetical protein